MVVYRTSAIAVVLQTLWMMMMITVMTCVFTTMMSSHHHEVMAFQVVSNTPKQHCTHRRDVNDRRYSTTTTRTRSFPLASTVFPFRHCRSDFVLSMADYHNNGSSKQNNGINVVPTVAPCTIQVIGVGGGGGNAVNHMIRQQHTGSSNHNNHKDHDSNNPDDDMHNGPQRSSSSKTRKSTTSDVAFWAINTDAQALSQSLVPSSQRINIGRSVTRGLGAGGDPTVGTEAALENAMELKRIVQNTDLVFITCGMGGGTGSGAAPILAQIAKNDCQCLTVGVVTKPFSFEGRRRMQQAVDAISQLRPHVDTLIVIDNDKLLQIVPDHVPLTQAFGVADNILQQAVMGITDMILQPGLVNVDFADVKTVMQNAGYAILGIGTGYGVNRATDAATAAMTSPLLDVPIVRAKRVVLNIQGPPNMTLSEINAACAIIYNYCDDNANIIFGATIVKDDIDNNVDNNNDRIRITVLACDIDVEGDSDSSPSTTATSKSFTNQPKQHQQSKQRVPMPSTEMLERQHLTMAPDVYLAEGEDDDDDEQQMMMAPRNVLVQKRKFKHATQAQVDDTNGRSSPVSSETSTTTTKKSSTGGGLFRRGAFF